MRVRLPPVVAVVATAMLLLTGCGEPARVTYVDPNAPSRTGGGAGVEEPFVRFGSAAALRSSAIIEVRAALAAARTLAASDARGAAAAVDAAVQDALPVIEPRVARANPSDARSLRRGLVALRDSPPADEVAYSAAVRRLSDDVLARAHSLAVGGDARRNVGYRAALLHETLQRAAAAYESAVGAAGTSIADPTAYLRAYGLVLDARTRQLDAIPLRERAAIASNLDQLARSTFPGPSPPPRPRDPESVAGELATIADDVARAAGVDPRHPEPDAATPDRLRALKRRIAVATEAYERGDHAAARASLQAAQREELAAAADSLAAAEPSMLVRLERQILIDIPRAMDAGAPITMLTSDVDGLLDRAIQLVEDEMELLDDA